MSTTSFHPLSILTTMITVITMMFLEEVSGNVGQRCILKQSRITNVSIDFDSLRLQWVSVQ